MPSIFKHLTHYRCPLKRGLFVVVDLAEVGVHIVEQDLISEPGRQWTYIPLPSTYENDNLKSTVTLMRFNARMLSFET